MEAIKQFVTDLVLNTDRDIDEVLTMAIDWFRGDYTEDEIEQAFEDALNDLPELN